MAGHRARTHPKPGPSAIGGSEASGGAGALDGAGAGSPPPALWTSTHSETHYRHSVINFPP